MTVPVTPVGTRLFSPSDPAVIENPYPSYAQLRDHEPVAYLAEHDLWLISRYADVTRVLREPATFSSRVGMNPDLDGQFGPTTGIDYRFAAPDVRLLIATDPPEHQLFRRAVAGAFSTAAVARIAGRVTELADQCVNDLITHSADGVADFYALVAEPLPVLVLAELFGIPPQLHAEFRAWTALMTADLDEGKPGAEAAGKGIAMFRYFSRQLKQRSQDGPATLFQSIAAANEAGVTDRELLAFCAFLLFAGIETTSSLLTNLLAALFQFPQVFSRLRREPDLTGIVIEEGLRYDTSVQILWRGTTEPVELAGTRLPAGSRLAVAFGSANRDERRFPDPDHFRLDRGSIAHVGFGGGPHVCLGARLARLQLTATLRALLAATSRIEPAGAPTRMRSIVLRGLNSQPVSVDSR